MLPKSQKYGQNNKNTSEIRAIFPKRPYIRAYPYKYGRLRHTAPPLPQCVRVCEKAVEVGRENRADFKLIAKAMFRCGEIGGKEEEEEVRRKMGKLNTCTPGWVTRTGGRAP